MKKSIIRILLFITIIFTTNCMGPGITIFIDENADLSKFTEVEWAITKSDSIIDFSKGIEGFAKIENDLVIETIDADSIRTYKIKEFKTIYANDGINVLPYAIVGVSAVFMIIMAIIGPIKAGG